MLAYVLIVLLLAFLAVCMRLFRIAALRPAEVSAEEKLDQWEKERGWDVALPRAGVAWYRAQRKETVTAVSRENTKLTARTGTPASLAPCSSNARKKSSRYSKRNTTSTQTLTATTSHISKSLMATMLPNRKLSKL